MATGLRGRAGFEIKAVVGDPAALPSTRVRSCRAAVAAGRRKGEGSRSLLRVVLQSKMITPWEKAGLMQVKGAQAVPGHV